MTRLKPDDIAGLASTLTAYDARLLSQTGQSLKGLAGLSAGIREGQWQALVADVNVGVVPFSCGQGIIGRFSETVAGIINHIGGAAFVTSAADASGLAAACEQHADILFMADEDRFVAIDLIYRRVVDNADMTGRGFALGLSLMAGGITGKTVLVIGCGKVGGSAAVALLEMGADVAVYDVQSGAVDQLIGQCGGQIRRESDLNAALTRYDLILDASPAADIICSRHIRKKTYVAAPGMPCAATAAAARKLGRRLLHDPLQVGVACMLAEAVKINQERSATS